MLAKYQSIRLKKGVTVSKSADRPACTISYDGHTYYLAVDAYKVLSVLQENVCSYHELVKEMPEELVQEVCTFILDYGLATYVNEVIEPNIPSDLLTPDKMGFMDLYRQIRPFTMLSTLSALAVYDACTYLVRNNIEGDVVFTGAWRGGATYLATSLLTQYEDTSRDIYIYDTFDWTWPAPSIEDFRYQGRTHRATESFVRMQRQLAKNQGWVQKQMLEKEQVASLLSHSGYPDTKLFLLEGFTEDSFISNQVPKPSKVAFSHLDTDFYFSTKSELEFLYPRLNKKGLMIVDDYGTENGATKALDEYFAEEEHRPFFHRIDYQGVLLLK